MIALLEQAEKEGVSFSVGIRGFERDKHLRNCVRLLALLYDGPRIKVTVSDGGSPVEISRDTYHLILANPPFRSQSLRDREAIDDNRSLPIPTKDVHRAFLQRILLGLGAGVVGPQMARQIVTAFLTHSFEGGRHQRRIDKIAEVEGR